MGNRRVVERWVAALEADDLAAQRALLHDEFVGRYPQSGEVIRGPDDRIAIAAAYPEWDRTSSPIKVERITGTDHQFVTVPSGIGWSIVHLSGSDDEFTITGAVTSPTVRSGTWWGCSSCETAGSGARRATSLSRSRRLSGVPSTSNASSRRPPERLAAWPDPFRSDPRSDQPAVTAQPSAWSRVPAQSGARSRVCSRERCHASQAGTSASEYALRGPCLALTG